MKTPRLDNKNPLEPSGTLVPVSVLALELALFQGFRLISERESGYLGVIKNEYIENELN
jgi:hypothetical protein